MAYIVYPNNEDGGCSLTAHQKEVSAMEEAPNFLTSANNWYERARGVTVMGICALILLVAVVGTVAAIKITKKVAHAVAMAEETKANKEAHSIKIHPLCTDGFFMAT